MPLINSPTLLCSLSGLHLAMAYYLLANPAIIAHHQFVLVIGASMGLPPPTPISATSPSLPLAAALISLLSVSDLTAALLPSEIYSYYFSSQAPMRLLFFFAISTWIYITKSGGVFEGGKGISSTNAAAHSAGGMRNNGLVFTWAFVEMIWWFWIYVTLRDERRELVAKAALKRSIEEEKNRD